MPVYDDEVRDAITKSARHAVYFELVYPPTHTGKPTSFFGGRPLLPPEIEWPVHEITVDAQWVTGPDGERSFVEIKAPVAPTFLGQIDLSQLPKSAELRSLPRRGTLFFFFDSATSALDLPNKPGTGGRVIYWPGDSAICNERAEPDLLRPCYGDDACHEFEWMKHLCSEAYPYPRSFSKWEVSGFLVRTFAGQPDKLFRNKQERAAMLADWQFVNEFGLIEHEMQQEEFSVSFPKSVQSNRFVWQGVPRSEWRGGPGFPYTWICIEIFCGMMLNKIIGSTEPSPDESEGDRFDELEKEVRHWLARSRSTERYGPVGESARHEFWEWYETTVRTSGQDFEHPGHWGNLQSCLAEAYMIGPRLSLAESADAANLVPLSWIEEQRWQFSPNVADYRNEYVQHRLLGAHHDSPSPEHVLLMQFDSQYGMNWMWCDVGVVQYWIRRQDLRAKNFDKVIVTTHGG